MRLVRLLKKEEQAKAVRQATREALCYGHYVCTSLDGTELRIAREVIQYLRAKGVDFETLHVKGYPNIPLTNWPSDRQPHIRAR